MIQTFSLKLTQLRLEISYSLSTISSPMRSPEKRITFTNKKTFKKINQRKYKCSSNRKINRKSKMKMKMKRLWKAFWMGWLSYTAGPASAPQLIYKHSKEASRSVRKPPIQKNKNISNKRRLTTPLTFKIAKMILEVAIAVGVHPLSCSPNSRQRNSNKRIISK